MVRTITKLKHKPTGILFVELSKGADLQGKVNYFSQMIDTNMSKPALFEIIVFNLHNGDLDFQKRIRNEEQ